MGTLCRSEFLNLVKEISLRNPVLAESMLAQYGQGGKAKGEAKSVRVKRMSKPEKYWGIKLLEEKMAGLIKEFEYEPEKIKLGKRCTYTPDYKVTLPDGRIRIDECKGPFIREDAWIKIKWVAQKYPEYEVRVCQMLADGRWKIIEIGRE